MEQAFARSFVRPFGRTGIPSGKSLTSQREVRVASKDGRASACSRRARTERSELGSLPAIGAKVAYSGCSAEKKCLGEVLEGRRRAYRAPCCHELGMGGLIACPKQPEMVVSVESPPEVASAIASSPTQQSRRPKPLPLSPAGVATSLTADALIKAAKVHRFGLPRDRRWVMLRVDGVGLETFR